jgi:hypothetical protein
MRYCYSLYINHKHNIYEALYDILQDVDGRIILGWIFRKLEGIVGTGWSWFRIGTGGGLLWVR